MNPILALITANIIWGAAAPIFKFSLTNIPPFTLAFIRFFFGALLFIPFVWRFNFKSLNKQDWLQIFLGAFFGININIAFFFLGLQKGVSINAPIIASSGPILIFLGAIIFLHEKIKKKVLFGMSIAFSGVALIVFLPLIKDGQNGQNLSAFTANIYYFIATLGAVIAPLLWKRVLFKVNVYVVTFVSFLLASFTFLPIMLSELEHWSFRQLNNAGITGIVFGVFFSSALAYLLFNYGISKIKAQEVGLFTYVDPVIAVLIAAPLLQEYPNLYFILGSLLVFAGIFVAEGRIHYHPVHKIRSFAKKASYAS